MKIMKIPAQNNFICWWHTDMSGQGKKYYYCCVLKKKEIANFVIYSANDDNKRVVTVKIFVRTKIHIRNCLMCIIDYIENNLHKHVLLGVSQKNFSGNIILSKISSVKLNVVLTDFADYEEETADLYLYESNTSVLE